MKKIDKDDSYPPIIKEEYEKILMNMKDVKAVGIDGILVEPLINEDIAMWKTLL